MVWLFSDERYKTVTKVTDLEMVKSGVGSKLEIRCLFQCLYSYETKMHTQSKNEGVGGCWFCFLPSLSLAIIIIIIIIFLIPSRKHSQNVIWEELSLVRS